MSTWGGILVHEELTVVQRWQFQPSPRTLPPYPLSQPFRFFRPFLTIPYTLGYAFPWDGSGSTRAVAPPVSPFTA
jgi:hypothetical protein